MQPTRRDLVYLALHAAALPGAASFFSQWMQAAEPHQHGSDAPPQPPLLAHYEPRFFDAADFAALQAFTEILIPSDETPGAREAHCAHFIDFVLHSADGLPETQKPWRDAMDKLRQSGFHDASPDRRLALVAEMSAPERPPSPGEPRVTHAAYHAYRLIKTHNAFAFFTSRAGMIDMLDYKGNSYNITFPACTHPEHQTI